MARSGRQNPGRRSRHKHGAVRRPHGPTRARTTPDHAVSARGSASVAGRRLAAPVLRTRGSRARTMPVVEAKKVAVLGAAGGIGQPLSLLLKMNKLVTELALYDIANVKGVAADISHCNTPVKVRGGCGGVARAAAHAAQQRRAVASFMRPYNSAAAAAPCTRRASTHGAAAVSAGSSGLESLPTLRRRRAACSCWRSLALTWRPPAAAASAPRFLKDIMHKIGCDYPPRSPPTPAMLSWRARSRALSWSSSPRVRAAV